MMVLHPATIARSPGLYAALAVFLIAVAVSGLLFSQFTTSSAWVMHTHSVITELEEGLADLLNVESAVRGFAITGNRDMLAPVRRSAESSLTHLTNVADMTADAPEQQSRAKALKTTAILRIAAAERLIDMPVSMRKKLLPEEVLNGKRLMDQFHKQKVEMESYENGLLRKRQDSMYKMQHATMLSIAALFLLSILSAGWSFKAIENRSEILAELNHKLRAKEEETRDLFETAPCGYHSLDDQGTLVRINATELGWLGLIREDVVGKMNFRDLLAEHSIAYFEKNFPVFKKTGIVRNLEFTLKRKDGTQFPVLVNSDAVFDHEQRFLYSRSTVFDMTERKRLEAELHGKNEELQRANLAKDNFLACMSHELRTPLNSILGFSGILLMELSGPLNEEQHKQIGYMQSSGKHLLSLINDILDLAKIESGNLTLSLKPVSVQSIVQEVIEVLKPLGQVKNVELVMRPYTGNDLVLGDARSLSQIALNLLNNALKFTDKGSVIVEFSDQEKQLHVSVVDTGIGISSEDQKKLFRGFVQIAHSDRATEGTGLGLHLSEKLAGLMGGHIELESAVGKGSRFTVVLPLVEV